MLHFSHNQINLNNRKDTQMNTKLANLKTLTAVMAGCIALTSHASAAATNVATAPVHKPALREMVAPTYPKTLRAKGVEGSVRIKAKLDTQGNLSDLSILESSHHLFSEASLAAVSDWKFTPVMVAGAPRETFVVIPLQFKLVLELKPSIKAGEMISTVAAR